MKVASLELCKELYELSGWEDTYMAYWNRPNHRPAWLLEAQEYLDNAVGAQGKRIPAYDLGYLLRKLLQREEMPITYGFKYGKWYAMPGSTPTFATTPEDAACKLSIELFKQGILTRE